MIALSIEVEILHGVVARGRICAQKLVRLRSLARWPMFHRGRVTDSSGPAVLNANVVAVQNTTKVSYMRQTTAAGDYSLPQVDVET
jgi:hypothetical protein